MQGVARYIPHLSIEPGKTPPPIVSIFLNFSDKKTFYRNYLPYIF